MDDEVLVIKNAKLEYLTTKTDNYDNEVSYFKIKDKSVQSKLEKYSTDDFRIPTFNSDNGKSQILKAKHKYVKVKSLSKSDVITVELTFKKYDIDDKCGFYVSSIK